MTKQLFKILLFFYFATGFCQEDSKSNFKKLFINEEKYSITFPSDWGIENTDSLKYRFRIIKEKSNPLNIDDGIISMRVYNLGYPKVKLKLVKKVMESKLKFAEILSNREMKKGKLSCLEYVYKRFEKGKSSTFLVYLFVKGTYFYTLIFACDSSEYLQNISIAQSIIETFEIK